MIVGNEDEGLNRKTWPFIKTMYSHFEAVCAIYFSTCFVLVLLCSVPFCTGNKTFPDLSFCILKLAMVAASHLIAFVQLKDVLHLVHCQS